MIKDGIRSISVVAVVSFITALCLRLAGVVENLNFWWGTFAALLLPPMLGWFLKKHFDVAGKTVMLIAGAIYVLLGIALYPYFVEHFVNNAPFIAEALTHHGVDTDIQMADRLTPSGTGLRIVTAKHRAEREKEITRWAAEELAEIRRALAAEEISEDDAEYAEQKTLEWKADHLKAVQKIRLPEDQESLTARLRTAGDFFRGLTPSETAQWPWWVFLILLVALWFGWRAVKKSLPASGLVRVPATLLVIAIAVFLAIEAANAMSRPSGRGRVLTSGPDFRTSAGSYYPSKPRADFQENVALVDTWTAKHPSVPRNLVLALIREESDWDPGITSPKGAKGLMQLMDSTASEHRVQNVFDPSENIRGGVEHLEELYREFGDWARVLVAYNWGQDHVRAGERVPAETLVYVNRVLARAQGNIPAGVYAEASQPALTVVNLKMWNSGDEDVQICFRGGCDTVHGHRTWEHDWKSDFYPDEVWESRDMSGNVIRRIPRPKTSTMVEVNKKEG